VRTAFLLLVVVALIIVGLGAANTSIKFDFDMVFGTWTAVSLIWVAAVFAGVVLVVGLVAAWLAQREALRTRRKLEVELQATYERLRAAEARLPQEPKESPESQEAPEAPSSALEHDTSPGAAGEDAVPPAG
jgi:uncharacterized membrane protein YciS (DUF1049 family)